MSLSILFVDDDALLLEGIARVLKTSRRDITFELCQGMDEAMQMLKHMTFTAVVADYRMPGRDGLQLLAAVKTAYPGIKRILLTGQSEAEVFQEASAIVDRYIAKPCEVLDIIDEVEKLIMP